MNGKQVLRLLKNNGWVIERISGSHYVLAKGRKVVSVPVHGQKDLKIGTLKNIEKISGVKLT
ncbi:MAG TPA: type II toxin-antitoxin system HicA family toxin [Syntrophobacteraceae bacterium]|nr:type II toxin-antitoxin system HicA family toxin [Syntrophobacteraceae bacterium]